MHALSLLRKQQRNIRTHRPRFFWVFEVLDAVEFLHRVCLHIPDPYESLIRYYVFYANAARGKRKKLGIENSNKDNIEIKILDDS